MSDVLNSIVEKLSSITDLRVLGATVESIRGAYDVDHVYYHALSLGLDAPVYEESADDTIMQDDWIVRRGARAVAAITYSPQWIERYFEARYDAVDPVLHGSLNAFAPIDWAELDWSEAPRKRFFQDAGDHGIGNQGYTVPVRGPNGQFALFTVNKRCSPTTWAKFLAEYNTDFMVLAHHTHQQVLRLTEAEAAAGQNARNLSARELDAVRLIAEGLSRGQAAEKLGISENTFRVYVDSARHKLGALNIHHAVALAAFKGVITPQ